MVALFYPAQAELFFTGYEPSHQYNEGLPATYTSPLFGTSKHTHSCHTLTAMSAPNPSNSSSSGSQPPIPGMIGSGISTNTSPALLSLGSIRQTQDRGGGKGPAGANERR